MADIGTQTGGQGGGLIMLVDDTPENLSLLRQILAAANHETSALPDGELAIAACRKRKPDLILLDVNMPGLDGFEVCRRLKSDPSLADIPILFLSALSNPEDKLAAFEAGGVDYITKPFQAEEVIARVRSHLSISRLTKDLETRNRELSTANDNLIELENTREMLVQTIVHDMRSMLMAVQGYLDLLASMTAEDFVKYGHSDANKALVTTGLLTDMTSAVLDVGKMEEKALSLELTEFDLSELIKEVIDRLTPLRAERTFIPRFPAEEIRIFADRVIIGRVALNLIVNAIKFTHVKRGVIEYGASVDADGGVLFVVADNGPGVPEELREKVFEKFWQGVGRRDGHKYGSGLGLTFCRMAVERHGGRLWVEGNPGGGSRFVAALKRYTESR